jgi:hypothetical protein
LRSPLSIPRTPYLIGIVAFLCATHFWLSNRAIAEKCTTADEIAHITGGYTFNHWNDYRLQPENGNLPQRWQTLPIGFMGINYPSQTQAWGKSDVWAMGYRFLYQSGNDPAKMLMAARMMNSCFGIATALLVFFWSRNLWGSAGGLVSMLFCVFCPTMLAHSALATSDMCMAFFLLASVSAYWRHLNSGDFSTLALSSVIFGLACVAKFTCVLLPVMAVMLIFVRLCRREPLRFRNWTFASFRGKAGMIFASLAIHGLVGLFVIWLFYGFRYTAFNPSLPPGEFIFPWELMLSFGGWKAKVIELFRSYRILPEGYLYGLAFVLKHAEARGAFLDGAYGIYGWVSFFPKAFIYKTPFSLIVAIGLAGALLGTKAIKITGSKFANQCYRVAPLGVLFGLYWVVSLASHLNIGHRHLLPIYPVVYIFCGALGWSAMVAFRHSRAGGLLATVLTTLLLGWHIGAAAMIYPDFLAYFSPLVGGPSKGYKHLVDSSLDWGQDLPGLKKWLGANQRADEPVYLSYFGNGDPDYYGIKSIHVSMLPEIDPVPPQWYYFKPGIYAISATMLQQVYAPQQGVWSFETERQYQRLRQLEPGFKEMPGPTREKTDFFRGMPANVWSSNWNLYRNLRFARLCLYLRERKPDAMIGYSILIFRLSSEEIHSAVESSAVDLEKAITKARAAQSP